VKKHAKEQWMVLYIERWLKAPVQEEDGQLVPREKGTWERFAVSYTRKTAAGSPARRPAVKKKPAASPAGSA
jgi:hypothetical protein